MAAGASKGPLLTVRRPWGIVVLCIWSSALAVEVILRAGMLALQQSPLQEWTISLTLPLAIAAAACAISLVASCTGLWRMRPWARKLFLAQITLYYGLLFFGSIALWGPVTGVPLHQSGQGWVTIVVLEGVLGLSFGWWYLCRDTVRQWFQLQNVESR